MAVIPVVLSDWRGLLVVTWHKEGTNKDKYCVLSGGDSGTVCDWYECNE